MKTQTKSSILFIGILGNQLQAWTTRTAYSSDMNPSLHSMIENKTRDPVFLATRTTAALSIQLTRRESS
jgi:hypothetical protein